MNEAALRDEICRVGRSLHARGYVHGSTGNISARLDDAVLITATDACLGDLEPDALAKVGDDGSIATGQRPSKTLALHRSIYAATAEARCIVHTHSHHLVGASLDDDAARDDFLPPITPYFVMKVGHVPLIAYRRPGDPAAAALVEAAIARFAARGTPIRAVMLARLGPVVWHESLSAACAVLEEIEATARLCTDRTREAPPLSEERIGELRTHFGARW